MAKDKPKHKTPAGAAHTPAQKAALARAKKKKAQADALAKAEAQRLAQIVNLMIGGYSLADIAAATGSTIAEIDALIQKDAARYVRSQPALRVYVRNWISQHYTQLLSAVWDEATDKHHPKKLENQDRAVRILERMERLHGAAAPVQAEVKIEAAPEAVEKMVEALAASHGLGYDVNVFDTVEDVVDAELVHEAVDQSHMALEKAGRAVEDIGDEGEAL